MPVVRIAALLLGLSSATLAHAIAQRTFVASTGADANTTFNCSLVKPCRGFAAAISVTNAKGEVLVLDSAGYGAIPSITQEVSINAPTGIYGGISVFSGDGITINAGSATVVLRGLVINGQGGGNGITITNALTVHIENCVIANMSGIGISHLNGTLEVKDTIVRNNANIGIYIVGPARANLDHVRLEVNDTGLAAEIGAVVVMQDSVVTRSDNVGLVVNNAGGGCCSHVTIARSMITMNNYGILVDGSGGESVGMVSDCTISGNNVGVHVAASPYIGVALLKRNVMVGNGLALELVSLAGALLEENTIGPSFSVSGNDVSVDASSNYSTRDNNTIRSISAVNPPNHVPPQ